MDPFSSSLQVPDNSLPGPSRSQGYTRPVSVQPTSASTSPSASTRKRASHTVVTGQQQEEQPTYRDVYSHPAAMEYAAAHPRRTIPKFGPYLLLQTLGEGEFGKVKLGLHMQWGEEVAVKLIRRGNIDTSVRMSKVEREIEVLRTLKHPNIVRLYDVIETDKYIGIILEYASGGELFDHILAHRYLREKDACKLFSQLLSGVWYIHQKKIVHRDLKLENLLLDRHRNVIITDFGFANRFEHRSDDLMQTSCGSPCYAAPELVISDGLYVGSAVDIWSCGVILYAMLAGYLPFDDDPANPDGDNINLLYKYIVNTPLSFPEYISADARDLLSLMLVPDPVRRADLKTIMEHRWLESYASIFSKSVDDLERAAMEQHHQKRLAYQKQMRQTAAEAHANKVTRSHSARTDGYSSGVSPAPAPSSRSYRHAQPEYLYEASPDHSVYATSQSTSRRGVNSAIVMPTSPPVALDDDPFAPTLSQEVPSISIPVVASPANDVNGMHEVTEEPRTRRESESRGYSGVKPTIEPVKMSPDAKRKGGFRHTIQVEPPEETRETPQQQAAVAQAQTTPKKTPSFRGATERNGTTPVPERRTSNTAKPLPSTPSSTSTSRHRQEASAPKLLETSPAAPALAPPVVSIEVTSPPITPLPNTEEKAPSHAQTPSGSMGSGSSKQSRHKKGLSIDKIGIGKIFGSSAEPQQTNGKVSREPSQKSTITTPGRAPSTDTITANAGGKLDANRRPSTVTVPTASTDGSHTDVGSQSPMLSPPGSVSSKNKSRRNTLTVIVEPFRKQLTRSSKATETPAREKHAHLETEKVPEVIVPHERAPVVPPTKEMIPPATPTFASGRDTTRSFAVPASTVKASKVMGWFRSKSKGKALVPDDSEKPSEPSDTEPSQQHPERLAAHGVAASSSSSVGAAGTLATPTVENGRFAAYGHPQRSASSNTEASFLTSAFTGGMLRKHPAPKGVLRVHHGAVDQTTITTGAPPEVMAHVKKVLEGMGVDFQVETDYKYRCVRPKRRKAGAGVGLGIREPGSGLAAFSMVGSAASNGVDKRGLPMPSPSSFSSTGGMLRGLLMRRQSSQVSSSSHPAPNTSFENDVAPEAALAAAVPQSADGSLPAIETIYGDITQDQGDEVRFSVELTRLDRLDDTYSLDIRRLKGNLRSYKFLYDTLRERADLQR